MTFEGKRQWRREYKLVGCNDNRKEHYILRLNSKC